MTIKQIGMFFMTIKMIAKPTIVEQTSSGQHHRSWRSSLGYEMYVIQPNKMWMWTIFESPNSFPKQLEGSLVVGNELITNKSKYVN